MRKIYIHQQDDWPIFFWDDKSLINLLGRARYTQGKIVGKMEILGFDLKSQATLETVTLDVLKSAEIEGEIFEARQVRSSVARHLNIDVVGLVPSDRDIDGFVNVILDATQNADKPLTPNRLFGWHKSLFPPQTDTGFVVGGWRTGPIQVVSGPMGKEKIHFEGPSEESIDGEMAKFLTWFNKEDELDPVIKAGMAHFWFVTIHPFEDGNGRVARVIADMLLARADQVPQRFYSMSAQIRIERNDYYDVLEKLQKNRTLDITEWLCWFLNCFGNAMENADKRLSGVINKHNFWMKHKSIKSNKRQVFMLNKLLDMEFYGELSSTKWMKMTDCSEATALRDIKHLVAKGILKAEGKGKSTRYGLVWVIDKDYTPPLNKPQ